MNSKPAFAAMMCLLALGCGGNGDHSSTTQPPTPEWTITAVSASGAVDRTSASLGTLYDAGTVIPGQTVSGIKFLAVATNGYDKTVQLSDVASSDATHIACIPSAGSITPTSAGAPFTVSFTVPANYPYAGSGASFEGTDPTGAKKSAGIAFKVQTVSGAVSKQSYVNTALAATAPIKITPIDGFTGAVAITFDRTFQTSDAIPTGYVAVPNGVTLSAQSVTISGSAAATANASFTWSSWTAGTYAVVAVLTKGTMAIRVPIEITVTAGSGSGPVGYSTPTSLPGGNGARVLCVSPGGKMAGVDASNNLEYWSSPTSTPVSVSSSGLDAEAAPVMVGINDSGVMVGNAAQGPCYWSSPTANAVYLKMPTGYNRGSAYSINASGQIVGSVNMSGALSTAMGAYWSSPTATPVLLSQTFGGVVGEETVAWGISNSGVIAGTTSTPTNSQQVLIWNSATSNPTDVGPSSATLFFLGMNQTTGAVCGRTQNTPYVWSPTSYAPQQYAGSGFPNAVGSDGVAVGSDVAMGTATVWTSPTAQPVALSTLTSGANGWTLQQALFMTNSGTVIGSGVIGGSSGVFVVQRTK